MQEEHRTEEVPDGFYMDGKQMNILVRGTTDTKVSQRGKRGKKAYKVVHTTGNKLVQQTHYPVMAVPAPDGGAKYITHITPADGTGKALATDLVEVIRERGVKAQVVGMDGCPVNCGINNGAFRQLELKLGYPVQHAVCGLHLTELIFWHILLETDGVTAGPECLTGPIGSTLKGKIWEDPVVSFTPITGNVKELPMKVVADFSRDQLIGYRYCLAIQRGVMEDNLPAQTIGPMVTSRWLTTAIRVLCKYTRTRRPTQKLIRLVKVILLVYFPGWFEFKHKNHIQDAAINYFFLVQLSRELDKEYKVIIERIVQIYPFWPQSEIILIAMLKDSRDKVRRMAVTRIQKAMEIFNPEEVPRQFIPPEVNF